MGPRGVRRSARAGRARTRVSKIKSLNLNYQMTSYIIHVLRSERHTLYSTQLQHHIHTRAPLRAQHNKPKRHWTPTHSHPRPCRVHDLYTCHQVASTSCNSGLSQSRFAPYQAKGVSPPVRQSALRRRRGAALGRAGCALSPRGRPAEVRLQQPKKVAQIRASLRTHSDERLRLAKLCRTNSKRR